MNNVKNIRLNRVTGEVACYNGTTEIFSVNKSKLKADSEIGLINYIKHCGSIDASVRQFKALN